LLDCALASGHSESRSGWKGGWVSEWVEVTNVSKMEAPHPASTHHLPGVDKLNFTFILSLFLFLIYF